MSKLRLGLFGASMLALVACAGADDADIQGDDGVEELEHRAGGRDDDGHHCGRHEDVRDKRGSGGGHSDSKGEGNRHGKCEGEAHGGGHRDGGTSGRADGGSPRPTRDAGAPQSTRDAGGPVLNPPRDPGGPVIVDDPNVIKLPDGTVIRLDGSCPSYPTPFSVTLPGCCLPAGVCGLSTHEVNVANVPKGCFSYEQGKTLDPSFSLPEKRCTVR